jgi:predicted ribosomally synthesized peptide with SipW-like signal peptide
MKAAGLILATALVGAVAVGGAVTGTTLALWRDQEQIPASSVTSGSIGLAVNGRVTLDLGDRFALMKPGETRTQRLTFTNTGSGSNLLMRVSLMSVARTIEAGSPQVPLTIEYRRSPAADDCSAASGYVPLPETPPSGFVALSEPIAPGASSSICLRVRLDSTSLPDRPAASKVTITLRGDQVR